MDSAGLERYVHRDPSFAIDLPDFAERLESPDALLTAREPDPGFHPLFLANLTVVVEPVPAGIEFEDYAVRSTASVADLLPGLWEIDREPTEIAGRPALRTLVTYLPSALPAYQFPRELSVALEQWRVLDGERAWVVSVSCEAVEFDQIADVWRACAESFAPGATR